MEEDLPSLGDKPAALALGRPASLPACSLVTLSTMKSVETSEVCSRQARRRERTKEVHFLDTTTDDRGADLSHQRTGFDKWQISIFPYISAIKEVFLNLLLAVFPLAVVYREALYTFYLRDI